MPGTEVRTGYARAGELSMYYEIHGEGEPLILLHGAYMTTEMLGPLLSGLTGIRQVVALEQQGHGRTADVDRPLTYEQMADDTAAAMRHLEIDGADVVGYSMGGGIALQLAMRHPAMVRRLVVASASFTSDGMHPTLLEMIPSITPEAFAGSPMEEAYHRIAPDPGNFPQLVEKLKELDAREFSWPRDEVAAIAAPTLIVVGDSDAIRLEHALELFRLRGGGVMGDLEGLPESQLAVLPGTTHFVPPGFGLLDRTEWLLAMILPFLDPAAPSAP